MKKFVAISILYRSSQFYSGWRASASAFSLIFFCFSRLFPNRRKLDAVGTVSLGVSNGLVAVASGTAWNTNQGILPARVNLISLGGDVVNNASFTTYPDPNGTVNMLARGSVDLNVGFNLSDADPAIMPTLANIAGALVNFQTVVTQANASTATLTPAYQRLLEGGFIGGANYLAGQDTGVTTDPTAVIATTFHATVLQGDSPVQLIPSLALITALGSPIPPPPVENARHKGLHAGGSDPARIVALAGDVAQPTPAGFSQLTTSPAGDLIPNQLPGIVDPFVDVTKAMEIIAGRDVKYLSLVAQNNSPSDVTSIIAGRDVIYPALPLVQGSSPSFQQSIGIYVGGPGNLLVESGRNVDLGTSTGIQTFGNLLNTALPSVGAGITIETGLGAAQQSFAYTAFSAQYANPAAAVANPFAEPLQLFAADGTPIGSGRDAYAYLQTLSAPPQQILLNRIFFGLLRDSGRERTGATGATNYELGAGTIDTIAQFNSAFANYQRAFAATAALFGGKPGIGSFLGGLSTVRTTGGGDITIMSPHGQIEVGLASPPTGLPGYALANDPLWALNFGVVTERGGNVDMYADGSVTVNQSRVFTLEGGDLTVFSFNGNIDAGKGAKTVQAIQPPNVSYDVYGHLTVTPFGPSSGSGLAVLRALPGVPLGNADLIAVNGFVDAGDAGIRVSRNLNVAALAVLNAANIQVNGKATGVPTVEAPNIGALTAASNAAGAAAKTSETPAGSTKGGDRPSIIIVEVLGYGGGDEPPANDDAGKRHKDDSSQSQDPRDRVQILGAGEMTASQRRELLKEKRQLVEHE
jgi:hypothetical protein